KRAPGWPRSHGPERGPSGAGQIRRQRQAARRAGRADRTAPANGPLGDQSNMGENNGALPAGTGGYDHLTLSWVLCDLPAGAGTPVSPDVGGGDAAQASLTYSTAELRRLSVDPASGAIHLEGGPSSQQ